MKKKPTNKKNLFEEKPQMKKNNTNEEKNPPMKKNLFEEKPQMEKKHK